MSSKKIILVHHKRAYHLLFDKNYLMFPYHIVDNTNFINLVCSMNVKILHNVAASVLYYIGGLARFCWLKLSHLSPSQIT